MKPRSYAEFKRKISKKGMNVTRLSTEMRGQERPHAIPKNVPHEVREVTGDKVTLWPGDRNLDLEGAYMWEFEDAPEVGEHAFYAMKRLPGGTMTTTFLIEDVEGLDGID